MVCVPVAGSDSVWAKILAMEDRIRVKYEEVEALFCQKQTQPQDKPAEKKKPPSEVRTRLTDQCCLSGHSLSLIVLHWTSPKMFVVFLRLRISPHRVLHNNIFFTDQPAGHEAEHEREHLPQAVPHAEPRHRAARARGSRRRDQR